MTKNDPFAQPVQAVNRPARRQRRDPDDNKPAAPAPPASPEQPTSYLAMKSAEEARAAGEALDPATSAAAPAIAPLTLAEVAAQENAHAAEQARTTPPQPTAAYPRNQMAAPNTTGGTLGHVLAPETHAHHQTTPDAPGQDSVSVLAGLARMRQAPTDPMADYTNDSTRKLRWIQAAITQYSNLTGRSRQDIETRALLGIEPIPRDVLDANWLALYNYPRDHYQPQQR
jgi:hypothetical protein